MRRRCLPLLALPLLLATPAARADELQIFSLRHPLGPRAGFGMQFGATPDGHFLSELDLDLGWRLGAHVTLDMPVSFGGAPLIEGSRSAFAIGPAIEVHEESARRWLSFYARAAVPVQTRSGAGLEDRNGIAASLSVGVRLNFFGWFGLGYEARVQHNLTDWLMTPAVLPAGSTVLTQGFTLQVQL